MLIQPLIGALSDRTWSPRWARRKPFFLIGAIGCSICLFLFPFVTAVWMAVLLLWLWGGPAHLDTWDLKPTAPDSARYPAWGSRRLPRASTSRLGTTHRLVRRISRRQCEPSAEDRVARMRSPYRSAVG